MKWLATLFLLLQMSGAWAQAQYTDFTPESGWYWDPEASGRGINVEVQDNYVGVAVYTYDSLGNPTWYLAAGQLQGNSRLDATIDRFVDGQCIGCSYSAPTYQQGYAGNITIEWITPTLAEVWWPGEHFFVQRDWFGLGDAWQHMLGEWQAVLDFYGSSLSFPFLGDAYTFDYINGDTFVGYRNHTLDDAAGYPDVDGNYLIIVREDSSNWLALYITDVGTNRMAGLAEFYPAGGTPTLNGYPFTMHRTASASFVQSGSGPSKKATPAAPSGGLLARLTAEEKQALLAEMQARKPRALKSLDRETLTARVRQLEGVIEARRAARQAF